MEEPEQPDSLEPHIVHIIIRNLVLGFVYLIIIVHFSSCWHNQGL